MSATDTITSPQNRRVKALVKLRRRRARDAAGLFLIDEPLVIRRALEAGQPLQTAYYCRDLLTRPDDERLLRMLQSRAHKRGGAELVAVTPPVMRKIAYRQQPAPILVVAPQPQRTLTDLRPAADALVVILENIEKPGNLGAVLRSADGAGADAVVLCGRGTDPFNPNTLRASRGALFSVPTVSAEVADITLWLAERAIATVAAAPTATTSYTDADLCGPVALILGAEDTGLTPAWLARSDQCVRIPMRGRGDSLNVATCAALLLYEAVRQRHRRTESKAAP